MHQRMAAALAATLMSTVAAPVAFVTPASAQSASDTIQAIRIEGNERIEADTVRNYLAVQQGASFDPAGLDESLRALFATGLFDDVQLRREGDTLVVAVVENPIINRIAFEGNNALEDETLEAEVQLRPRVVYTRSRVQNALTRIIELYRRSGRFAATVEPKVIELDQNRVDVVFEINEGPETGVDRISFIGNNAFSASTLRGAIDTTESAWYRFFTSADTYDPDRLAYDQEMLRRFYRARGYADFQVVSALAELSPDGSGFFITFTVDEGQLYTFGDLTMESQVPDVTVDELQGLIEGSPGGVFNADQVEATTVAVTERLGELGYAFVDIEPQPSVNRDTNAVNINYVIRPGPRVYVERIDVTGNVRTLDSVIRREFRLAEGDAFNTVLLRRSEQRIQNLGFFERVSVTQEPGSAPDRTVIKVDVAERSTGELSFGAGFSTQDGPLGDIRLTERNLLGTGQEISARFTASGRRQEIDFGYTEPYFLGYEFAAGADVFRRSTDYQDESSYDERRTGARLRGSYPLTEYLRHDVRLLLERDEIRQVPDDASIFIQEEDPDAISLVPGQSLVYDRRDNSFLPSEGFILRFDQDIAIPPGDTQYVSHQASGSYYYPFTANTVLNLAARGGHVFGWGGEDVRLGDRYFIGGQTFRGFEFGGIGPRDSETDDSLGGNTYIVGTSELRFPLGLPEDVRLYGRVFGEAGTLYGSDLSGPTLEEDDGLRASVGVGLSWLSPLGPVSVDLAQAVVKKDEDQTELFRLSFGTRF